MKYWRRPRPWLLLISVILSALDTWSTRYRVNPMGISYLDMGDALMRGEWRAALNGLWSPLYLVPLGLMGLLNPSPRWEFQLVHLINFLIFIAALFSFDFFLRQVIRNQAERQNGKSVGHLPEWAMLFLGYAVFLWCTLGLINMSTTAPDLMQSIFVYLAFGKLLQIKSGVNGWKSFFALGIILGVGYLVKATMFPLAPLFMLLAVFFVLYPRKRGLDYQTSAKRFAAVVFGFVIIAAPFVLAFSASKDRLSFGDSGRLNYLWHVNRVPPFHWQGNDVNGVPLHPTRKILAKPAVYEFGGPFNATYAAWYDPSYWYDGAKIRFDANQQLSAIRSTIGVYLQLLFFPSNLVLSLGFAILLYFGLVPSMKQLISGAPILLLPLAAFLMYLPVHVEPRYVAAFIPPLWVWLFGCLRWREAQSSRRIVNYTVLAMFALLLLSQSARSIGMFYKAVTDARTSRPFEASLIVADELNRHGIQAGDSVGMVNFDSFWLPAVDWARLARVRIVAEMPNTEVAEFSNDPAQQQEVLSAFSRAGAKALVAVHVPQEVTLPGWERISDTSYYLFKLDQPAK